MIQINLRLKIDIFITKSIILIFILFFIFKLLVMFSYSNPYKDVISSALMSIPMFRCNHFEY